MHDIKQIIKNALARAERETYRASMGRDWNAHEYNDLQDLASNEVYMHSATGSVDTFEGWLKSYSMGELEERGYSTAEAAMSEDVASGVFVEVELQWVAK